MILVSLYDSLFLPLLALFAPSPDSPGHMPVSLSLPPSLYSLPDESPSPSLSFSLSHD